ncbi:MAG: FAD-dependent oxidoreductase [Acidobacteria bacterium]|nr:FAD-dependent oxidoreductase [Acidobacteriota bacterium]
MPRADGRILVGSTSEDVGFNESTTSEAIEHLIAMACRLLPPLENVGIADTWAGLRPFADDGMPVLGGFSDLNGLTIATGHFRNGILLAPVTAKLIAERVLNGLNDNVFSTFGPERFLRAAVAS